MPADASGLAKKLWLRSGYRAWLHRVPEGTFDLLAPLPDGVEVSSTGEGLFDFILVFVENHADIEAHAPGALARLKPGGVLWLAYPKRSKKVQTDINRDTGWESVFAAGWRPVTQVAIDETWSALRFKPASEVKPRKP